MLDDNHVHDFQQQSSRSLNNLSSKTEMTITTDDGDEAGDQFVDDPNASR